MVQAYCYMYRCMILLYTIAFCAKQVLFWVIPLYGWSTLDWYFDYSPWSNHFLVINIWGLCSSIHVCCSNLLSGTSCVLFCPKLKNMALIHKHCRSTQSPAISFSLIPHNRRLETIKCIIYCWLCHAQTVCRLGNYSLQMFRWPPWRKSILESFLIFQWFCALLFFISFTLISFLWPTLQLSQ